MNTALGSKINWTAAILLIVNGASQLGFLPEGMSELLVSAVNSVGAVAIFIFRTWFTDKS